MRTFVTPTLFLILLTLMAGCHRRRAEAGADHVGSRLRASEKQLVMDGTFSEEEASLLVETMAIQTDVRPLPTTESDLLKLISVAEGDAALNTERARNRVGNTFAVLANAQDTRNASEPVKNRLFNVSRRVIINPAVLSQDPKLSTITGSTFSIFRNIGRKDAVTLIQPYVDAKDKVISRLARQAIFDLQH